MTRKRKPDLEGAARPTDDPRIAAETRRLMAEQEAAMGPTERQARAEAERARARKQRRAQERKDKRKKPDDASTEQPELRTADPASNPRIAEDVRRFTEGQQQRIAEDNERNPVLPSLRTNPREAARILLAHSFTKGEMHTLIYYRETWYQYQDGLWIALHKDDVTHLLVHHLEDFRQIDAEGEIQPFATTQRNVSEIQFQVQGLVSIPSSMELPCVRDPNGWRMVDGINLMVCRGQLVDMLTEKSRPTLYTVIPNGADWSYDAAAENCPDWLKFTGQLFGNKKDELAMLQEWMGYVCSGQSRIQKGLIIVGPKRSGKGTIGHVLTNLLGESMVASPALHAIGTRFGLENLIDKRLCLISDARLSSRQDIFAVIETLLRIIGGDHVTVDRKNKGALDLHLGARVMMLSNEMPHLPDNSDAIHHRFVILQLHKSFLGHEDVHLLDKLNAELPAIANWAIEGYRRLVNNEFKFTEPKSSRRARNEWRGETNPLEEFVRGYCDKPPGAEVVPATFTDKYNIWREKNGMVAKVATNSLSKELKAMLGDGFRSRWAGNERVWKGIKLNERGETLTRPF